MNLKNYIGQFNAKFKAVFDSYQELSGPEYIGLGALPENTNEPSSEPDDVKYAIYKTDDFETKEAVVAELIKKLDKISDELKTFGNPGDFTLFWRIKPEIAYTKDFKSNKDLYHGYFRAYIKISD